MCGITGFINWQDDLTLKSHILSDMVKTLTSRGPDGQGMYVSPQAALGHRRLIVIDSEGGTQPLIKYRGNEKFVLVYNGELYNAPELRQELTGRGYDFTTYSDSEVLITAFMEWGAESVKKLNGIFAFAVWDEARESLFVARDRIGIKPLFYAHRGAGFIFGSELKALLTHPEILPQIDAEGLAEVFMIGPARTPGNGIFKNVKELKPGHYLILNRQDTTIVKYWSLESKPHTDDFETTAATVRELLEDSVKRQLVSNVPLCTMLSGGLDSSAITAIAANTYKEKGFGQLDTYSVDYVDNEKFFKANRFQPNSDQPWAKLVSEHFGTSHYTIFLDTPELADRLPDAALARDLPGMADTDTSLYLFCREIKKGATVALSGECADEIFGGYPWFYREEMVRSITFPWSMRPNIRLDWLSPEVKEMIRPLEYVEDRYQDALNEVPYLSGEDFQSARMREISYLSLTRFMPTLIDRQDRMSMASGLEVRVPFCDYRIVDYVWNVPWNMKYYKQREKGLLRMALKGLLPDNVLWRKKSPYPKTHNPSYTEAVLKKASSIFEDTSSPLLPLINVEKLKKIASGDLEASNIPWFGQLMSGPQVFAYLIQMEAWLKKYKVEIV